MWLYQLFLFLLLSYSVPSTAKEDQTVESLIAKGDQFRISRRTNDALSAYNEAVRLDPSNYMSYFKRAAVYGGIPGKEVAAIKDLSSVLQINPSAITALKSRASLYLKLGDVQHAEEDAKLLASTLSIDPTKEQKDSDEKEQQVLQNDDKKEKPSKTQDQVFVTEIFQSVLQAKSALEKSQEFFNQSDYDQCVQSASEGLSVAPLSTQLLKTRISCNLNRGLLRTVAHDLNTLEYLTHDESFYVKSALIHYYVLHEYETATSKLRKCNQHSRKTEQCVKTFNDIRYVERSVGKYSGIADIKEQAESETYKYQATDKIWKDAIPVILKQLDSKNPDNLRKKVKSIYLKDIGVPEELVKDKINPDVHSELLTGLEETLCVAFYNTKQYTGSDATHYCQLVTEKEETLHKQKDDETMEKGSRPKSRAQAIAHMLKMEPLIEQKKYEEALKIGKAGLQFNPENKILKKKVHEIKVILMRQRSQQNHNYNRNQNYHRNQHHGGRQRNATPNKDYYKILGVSKTANDKELRSAYREKTKQFHPDKYKGDLSAEEVDRKMAEVNQAYEVLSNPDLRRQVDMGIDPNNPDQPQQQQFHHGGGGGHHRQHFANQQAQQMFFQHFMNNQRAGGGNPYFQQFGGGGFQFQQQRRHHGAQGNRRHRKQRKGPRH